MKLCSKCNRIVTAGSYCADVECPSLDIVTAGEAPKVERVASIASEGNSFCGECGNALKHGAAFCGKCGSRAVGAVRDAAAASEPQIDAPIVSAETADEISDALPVEPAEEQIAQVGEPTESSPMEGENLPIARFCGECGSGLKPSATFCGKCGTPVAAFNSVQLEADENTANVRNEVGEEAESSTFAEQADQLVEAKPRTPETEVASTSKVESLRDEAPEVPHDEADEWLYQDEPIPLWKRRAIVAPLALILIASSATVYWTQFRETDPQQASISSATETTESDSPAQAPLLRGTYKGHLADQDITISVGEAEATTLVNSRGSAEYSNVVNGGKCTASLVPMNGGGVGGSISNAVNFRQEPVPSRPACPKDIPVRIDISDQPKGSDGVVQSIKVEWLNQDETKVLMSGVLNGSHP